jgi:hypothetical protein
MYCPKCDGFLEETPLGELKCTRVGWVYSKLDSDLLKAQYGDLTSEVRPPIEREQESVCCWYCPGCGLLLEDKVCPRCRRQLGGRLLYRLVERNPHP